MKESQLTSSWLKLGVFALIAAGVFSLLLVLSRTPGIQNIFPWIDFFHTALVVHVNLSVLIWFMAFSCLFWSLYSSQKFLIAERFAFIFCLLGTMLLVLAPFLGAGKPLINNYIPVLQHPLFFWAIGLFIIGVLIQTLRVIFIVPKEINNIESIAPYIAAVFTLISVVSLVYVWAQLPESIENLIYYEYLFWAPGHILQFSHTCLLLFSWFILIKVIDANFLNNQDKLSWLFYVLLLPLIYALMIFIEYEVFSPEYLTEFTLLMKYGGLTSLPLGLVLVWALFKMDLTSTIENRAAKAALFSSIVLFAAGGVIGFLIHGVNVVIPAHYHGSIVGVTLAFMGVSYVLLPQLGFRKPVWKTAHLQPYVYGGGQLMHVLGLAWSGGYGVQRKTAGSAQGLDSLPEIIGMGMMGFGGLISIIGGLMFLIVMLKSMWPERR